MEKLEVKKESVNMSDTLNNVYYDFENPGSFGGVLGLSRSSKIPLKKTRDWLMRQDVYTLHKPVRIHYSRRKTLALGEKDLFQADLVDVRHLSKINNNFCHILTVIDVFSKFAFAIPIKNKKPETIVNAFKTIFEISKPKNLQTDRGSEFYNSLTREFFKRQNINHYSTHSQTKASVVERFNRTLKNKLYRIFTYRNSYKYIDVLDKVLESYNNSIHRSIGMAPSKVTPLDHSKIFHKLYGKGNHTVTYKFKENDYVRISKVRKTFQKGYHPGWSEEVFVVHKRYSSSPPTYKLRDMQGEVIDGRFYQEELQPVIKSSDSFWSIEKILRTRGVGSKKEYFVKWTGFDEKFNSWIKASWLK